MPQEQYLDNKTAMETGIPVDTYQNHLQKQNGIMT